MNGRSKIYYNEFKPMRGQCKKLLKDGCFTERTVFEFMLGWEDAGSGHPARRTA